MGALGITGCVIGCIGTLLYIATIRGGLGDALAGKVEADEGYGWALGVFAALLSFLPWALFGWLGLLVFPVLLLINVALIASTNSIGRWTNARDKANTPPPTVDPALAKRARQHREWERSQARKSLEAKDAYRKKCRELYGDKWVDDDWGR